MNKKNKALSQNHIHIIIILLISAVLCLTLLSGWSSDDAYENMQNTLASYYSDVSRLDAYIIKLMVGRELINRHPKRERTIGDKLAFEVDSWNVNHPIYTDKKVIDNVSFNIKEGEIVGFYGLQGAGRTELVYVTEDRCTERLFSIIWRQ